MIGQRTRIAITTTSLLAALLMAGCYWTPNQSDARINLTIETRELEGSSTVEGYDGFFFGYVIGTSLLRGDQQSADEAFTELNQAFTDALTQLQGGGDLSDFEVSVSLPSYRLQADLFAGTSGSNSFRGLSADQEYLVVVQASQFSGGTGGIGYTTVSVDAGTSKTVALEVGSNWEEFSSFLNDQFGYTQPEESPSSATIELRAPSQEFGNNDPYYFDLVLGSTQEYTPNGGLDTWYAGSVTILDKDGNPIAKTGSRLSVPAEGSVRITGVEPGLFLKIMLTGTENRATTLLDGYYLTDAFTTTAGVTTTIDLSETESGWYYNL